MKRTAADRVIISNQAPVLAPVSQESSQYNYSQIGR